MQSDAGRCRVFCLSVRRASLQLFVAEHDPPVGEAGVGSGGEGLQSAQGRQKEAPGEDLKSRRIAQLEAKLANKNEVISELMEENVKARKANGEL